MHVVSSHNEISSDLGRSKLKAVYVEEEIVLPTNFQDVGEGIEITYVIQLYTHELVSIQQFDIALCNIIVSPKLIKRFFTKFSTEIPIVAISTSEDPTLAYAATSLKAKISNIPKTSNTKKFFKIFRVRREWVERTKR